MMIKKMMVLAVAGWMAVMTGCATTRSAEGLNTEYASDDTMAALDFWQTLPEHHVCTNNEAFHGLIEMADGRDANENYEQRVNWLKEKGWLSMSFDGAGDEVATRGTVAQVLVGALGIEGGLTMRLLGPTPRYAVRELVYLEIMEPSTEQQGLSGIEYVGIISRAQDYRESRS